MTTHRGHNRARTTPGGTPLPPLHRGPLGRALSTPPGSKIPGLCPTCGALVEQQPGPGRRRIYCSKLCRNRRGRPGPAPAPCPTCGADVPRPTTGARRYCSPACRPGRVDRDRSPRPCPTCGVSFSPSRRGPTRRHCSKRCYLVSVGKALAEPMPRRPCALAECDVVFQPSSDRQRCCCEKHGKLLYNRESRADGRQAPQVWDDARRERHRRRRELKKSASTGERVLLEEIAERDAWRCHLCGLEVPKVAWPDRLSPSLDHVVPLSKGGAHDPSNVRLAHLTCNAAKGPRERDPRRSAVAS